MSGKGLVKVSEYRVVYERDPESGWWMARVPEVRGCHTQGRTIQESKRRIREALGLFVSDADTAKLRDDIRIPAEARRAISTYLNRRRRAEKQEQELSEAQRAALAVLQQNPLNLSIRDTAAVLELSHQRVHQLLAQRQSRSRQHRRVKGRG